MVIKRELNQQGEKQRLYLETAISFLPYSLRLNPPLTNMFLQMNFPTFTKLSQGLDSAHLAGKSLT